MELSPFPFQGPLEPEEVTGREQLVETLVAQVTGRRVTALLGPRRYGKTSVLRKAAAVLSEMAVIWVDLYEVASVADVAARFDRAISEVDDGPFRRVAQSVAASLSLNLGVLRVDLRAAPRLRPDPSLALAALLEVLTDAAAQRDTLLIVDEFSFISRVPEAAGSLRTALQHHYRRLGVVFAGSQPSMMRLMFTSRAEPFYGQAELLDIGPLSLGALDTVIEHGFGSTGRRPGRLTAWIWELTRGHPMRSMQLADAAWMLTDRGDMVTPEVWSATLERVRRAENEPLERLFTRFIEGDKAVLRAVAQSGSVYGKESELLDIGGGAAAAARRRLLDSGDLVQDETGLRVTDPLMADWLRRRFPL